MPVKPSLIGKTFGSLFCIEPSPPVQSSDGKIHQMSLCRCCCGKVYQVRNSSLIYGSVRSCGCLRYKHGHSTRAAGHSRTYRSWSNMLWRCKSGNTEKSKYYSDRGIKVCERWLLFANFLADMGIRPPGLTLDRINNDGDYEPGNCHWADHKQQTRNRRMARILTVAGITGSLAFLCEHFKADYKMVHQRLTYGWPDEAALLTPKMRQSKGGRRNPAIG